MNATDTMVFSSDTRIMVNENVSIIMRETVVQIYLKYICFSISLSKVLDDMFGFVVSTQKCESKVVYIYAL